MKIRTAISALAAAFILSMGSTTPANAQAQRNYDCSKPGNANKAACKAAAKPAAASKPASAVKPGAAAKPAPAAKPVAVKPAPSARIYDCSKAGNANKAACKGQVATAPASKPAPAPASRPAAAPIARNYDCSKAGNANKTACKGAAAAAPAPVARPAAIPAAPKALGAATNAKGPQGATAKCRDNSYSNTKTHAGACSHHGGVAQWY